VLCEVLVLECDELIDDLVEDGGGGVLEDWRVDVDDGEGGAADEEAGPSPSNHQVISSNSSSCAKKCISPGEASRWFPSQF